MVDHISAAPGFKRMEPFKINAGRLKRKAMLDQVLIQIGDNEISYGNDMSLQEMQNKMSNAVEEQMQFLQSFQPGEDAGDYLDHWTYMQLSDYDNPDDSPKPNMQTATFWGLSNQYPATVADHVALFSGEYSFSLSSSGASEHRYDSDFIDTISASSNSSSQCDESAT